MMTVADMEIAISEIAKHNDGLAGDINCLLFGAMHACSLSEYEDLMKETEQMIIDYQNSGF